MKKVLINACTHGKETIGLRVIEALKALYADNPYIHYNVAHPEAVEAKVNFFESDLNRSFPGIQMGRTKNVLPTSLQSL